MAPESTGQITEHDLGFDSITEHTSAAFGLLRVSSLLADELDRELQSTAGMGLSEMLVLVQLMLAGGRFKMADLADALVVTRGGATKIVDRLVDNGFVQRVPSTEDRRVIYAVITDDAKALVRKYQSVFDGVARERLGGVLGKQMGRFDEMIDQLNCENPGWEPPDIDYQP